MLSKEEKKTYNLFLNNLEHELERINELMTAFDTLGMDGPRDKLMGISDHIRYLISKTKVSFKLGG